MTKKGIRSILITEIKMGVPTTKKSNYRTLGAFAEVAE
ncbi:hypothetical protein ADIS_3164 [Lunatimonas lonarensis]|uniref:Uncharacterized protein n=1 Tax=Lunatimonas lonarensis TaxID=1232681 RepID=R7ZQF8_9BACT|nr:hypothetical protein ADIS_3164 [Lunatimonas lonarensis]